jgi:hypothetical protein
MEIRMIKRLNFMAHRSSGIDGLVAVEGWIAKSFGSNSSKCAFPR